MYTNLTKLNELGYRFRNQQQAKIHSDVLFLCRRIERLAKFSPTCEELRQLREDFKVFQRLANEFALGSEREITVWQNEFVYYLNKITFALDRAFFELGKKGGDE